MKIGIDLRSCEAGAHSGINEYVIELLHALFAQDAATEYRLFYNSFGAVPPEVLGFSYPNVQLVRLRYPNKLLNFSLKFFHRPLIDRVLGGVDVLFVPNLRITPVSRACAKVLTIHDLSFELFPEFFSLKRRAWHWFVDPRREVRESAVITAVSAHTKEHLVRAYKVAADKVHVVSPGINPLFLASHSQKDEDRVRAAYQLPTPPRSFFLCLGTLEPRKNLESVLEAFARVAAELPLVDLVIAGAKGWLYERALELNRSLGLGERIRVIGFVEQKDKAPLYRLSRAVLYPSFFEGFGFPALEALAAHKPVITSAASSLPEITGAQATLINPYNLAELIAALREVGATTAQAKQDMPTQQQIAHFDWDASAHALKKTFIQATEAHI